jgi:formyl-CoA transferase
VVGQAINMTRTPEPAKLRPTPDLGQHTEEILRGLGYSDAAIAELRAREVV